MTKTRRQWLARARGAQTCPIRICRGPLIDETDGTGRASLRCLRCERRLAGICRDCPAPVEGSLGKAVRCARCKVVARQVAARRSELRDRDGRRRRARARYRANADQREKKAIYSRAWRARHEADVAKHKRREALRQSPSRLEYFRAYNAKRREQAPRGRGPSRFAPLLTAASMEFDTPTTQTALKIKANAHQWAKYHGHRIATRLDSFVGRTTVYMVQRARA